MTHADPTLEGLTRKERDAYARRGLNAGLRKRAQNARARDRRKAEGKVRIDAWVHRDQLDEIRRLLSLHAGALQRGHALRVEVIPSPDGRAGAVLLDAATFSQGGPQFARVPREVYRASP